MKKSVVWSIAGLDPTGLSGFQVDVVTSNRIEAEKILNKRLISYEDIQEAAHALLTYGAKSVLIKGGHIEDDLLSQDYWERAIQFGAEGVHLGQEDLPKADVAKIRQSGLYLGISTHCYYEVAAAHTFSPSYIACGPIYSTTSKVMSFKPQGIEQLQRWRRTLQYPLVAIGGINLERLPNILKTKIEGVSLISAITKAADPSMVTKQFLKIIGDQLDS